MNLEKQRDAGTTMTGRQDAVADSDEPMTETQALRLRTLSEQAFEPDAFRPALTKAEAARRIDALRAKLALQDGPPHTL